MLLTGPNSELKYSVSFEERIHSQNTHLIKLHIGHIVSYSHSINAPALPATAEHLIPFSPYVPAIVRHGHAPRSNIYMQMQTSAIPAPSTRDRELTSHNQVSFQSRPRTSAAYLLHNQTDS